MKKSALALLAVFLVVFGFIFAFAAPTKVMATNDQKITGTTVANGSYEALGSAAMITKKEDPTDKKILTATAIWTSSGAGTTTMTTKDALAINSHSDAYASGGGSIANNMTTSKMKANYGTDSGRVDLVLRL